MRIANAGSEMNRRDRFADVARRTAEKKPRKTMPRKWLSEARDWRAENGDL